MIKGTNVGQATKNVTIKGATLRRLSHKVVVRDIAVEHQHGFTLIELLVVVLIIGILAAVAVPQYQMAVVKSRYSTLKKLTSSIAQAEEVYYLKNGQYTDNFEELDIDMPAGKATTSTPGKYVYDWGNCRIGLTSVHSQVICENDLANIRYQQRFAYSPDRSNDRICIANNTDLSSAQAKVCVQETKRKTPNWGGAGLGYTGWSYKD